MRKCSIVLAGCVMAILIGCGDTPAPGSAAKKEAVKPEPLTGQTAVFRMYGMARQWAPDAQLLELQNMHLSETPDGAPGTGTAWEATFVSATLGKSRGYTYSIVDGEANLHKGSFAGQEEKFSGSKGIKTPFLMAAVKVDSDAAYKTAIETTLSKAADYDKRNPGKPITIMLERTNMHPDPAWRIVWGTSVGTSNFSVLIDASTGGYLETTH
jgi:hypothetical protein